MSFIKDIIKEAEIEWTENLNTSFLKCIKDGSLKEEDFINFLVQDVLYLKAHARVYGKALYISENLEDYRVFHSVLGVIDNSNESIQWNYIKKYGLSDEYISSVPPKKETQNSIDFILNIAKRDDLRQILFAILPCLLSYNYIFKKIYKDPKSVNSSYFDLIENYASYSYEKSCNYWIDYVERKCENTTHYEQKKLKDIFREANKLESSFWAMLSYQNLNK